MATLAYTLSEKTTLEVISQVRQSTAVDGTLRFLDLGATPWSRIMCVVEVLSDSERDLLMSFLDTNKTREIDVDINGTTYRGRIIPGESPRWTRASGLNTVTFGLQARAV